MEGRITKEVEEFLCVLKTQKGAPVDLNPVLAVSISNVICDIIMSVRFSHNDSRFRRFMDLIDEGFKLFGSMNAALFIPILRYLPGLQKTRKKIAEVRLQALKFLVRCVLNAFLFVCLCRIGRRWRSFCRRPSTIIVKLSTLAIPGICWTRTSTRFRKPTRRARGTTCSKAEITVSILNISLMLQ